MSDEEKKLFVGKKIKDIFVSGYYVELLMEDDTKLEYNASDGGYSLWEITISNCKEFLKGK